jgi:quercetin dioxygenase-like cupin family protein
MVNDPKSSSRPRGGIVPAGQGLRLQAGERDAGPTQRTVKVGPHSGSRLIGMLESELLPGGGFPGHVHDDYEEVFYVLAGEIDYLIGDTWATASTGSTVFVPAGRVHAFRNSSDKPARHLAIASPADAMTMIEELSRAAPKQRDSILGRYRSRLADQRR